MTLELHRTGQRLARWKKNPEGNFPESRKGIKKILRRRVMEDYDIDTDQPDAAQVRSVYREEGGSDKQRNTDERRTYLGNNENCYDKKMLPYRVI